MLIITLFRVPFILVSQNAGPEAGRAGGQAIASATSLPFSLKPGARQNPHTNLLPTASPSLLFFFKTEGRHANANVLSSRDEISQPGLELPTSSLRFGHLSTIIQ